MAIVITLACLMVVVAYIYGYHCGTEENSGFGWGDGFDDRFKAAKEAYDIRYAEAKEAKQTERGDDNCSAS